VAFLICAVNAIIGLVLTTSLTPVGEDLGFFTHRGPLQPAGLHAE
jgi:hypothetical protein